MKKTISILIIFILLFLIFEFVTNSFKNGHIIKYSIYSNQEKFDVEEEYDKKNGDTYQIKIDYDNNTFIYFFDNTFNKQKNIIKNMIFDKDDNNICIYPVLSNDTNSYIECISNNQIYSEYSYPNQVFVKNFKQKLLDDKVITLDTVTDSTRKSNSSTIYSSNLIEDDYVVLWNYKGIQVISSKMDTIKNVYGFDKYDNKLGVLIDKYYVVPIYNSSKVLEFNSVSIINVISLDVAKVDLGTTLSSSTYINGIVDDKIYYMDPSNVVQVELNPKNKNARIIGNKDINAQMYDGKWSTINIYDMVNNKKYFKTNSDVSFKYTYMDENNNSYYYYDGGNIYLVSKKYLDKPILLFHQDNLNNFNLVEDTIYYIVNDTVYYFNLNKGIKEIIKNNDLKYNSNNRLNVYRKS